MAEDGNIINAVASALGPFHGPATFVGVIGLFGAPILAFLSIKGVFTKPLDQLRGVGCVFWRLGSIAATLTGVVWLAALLSFFPGLLVCSVYCFLGLGLPFLGIATTVTCLLLVVGKVSARPVQRESA